MGLLRFFQNPGLGVVAVAAVAAAACMVKNPAFDLADGDAPGGGAIDVGLAEAAALEDAGGTVSPDAGAGSDAAAFVMPGCDDNSGDLAFCLDFEASLLDQSSNGVVVSGDPQFVPGTDGLAYTVKNAVGLQTPAMTSFASPRLTLDLWVKLTAWPETQTQVLAAAPLVMALYITGKGELVCDVGNIRTTASLQEVPVRKWQAVACVYDGVSIGIYINGLIAGSRAYSGFAPAVTKAPLFVGSAVDFDPFTGAMDNVRLWKRRLTPAELCASSPDQSVCSQPNP